MKILFVNNFRKRGGGEEFLRELLPGLAAKGITVGLVCRPGAPLADMFQGTGIKVYPIERSGANAITSVFKIAVIIRREGYDLVNIQRGHDIVQSLFSVLLSGTKPLLLYTPQVPEFIRSRFLLRRLDAIVTISRHIRDRLTYFDPALGPKTTIVYYGIDLEKFSPAAMQRGKLRRRVGLSPDTTIIGTVGDLWKNQIEFLDALSILRKQFPDIRYAIVGSDAAGTAVDAFKKRAEDLGLADAVLWPGRLSKEDMLSFYADIDLAVSTYRNEGFGIWILEAMAMGKPVIAYNAGGIRDSLEDSPCGMLVDGGAEEMAAAVEGLLSDQERLKAMSEHAPQWVRERYGRQRMIDDYDQYFRLLLAARQ